MLSVQRMAEIASRHLTMMADAMIRACVQWAVDNGELISVPERGRTRGITHTHGDDRRYRGVDWERMVRGNSDILGPQ